METIRLSVENEGKFAYDIVVDSSFDNLGSELEALDVKKRKICIVTERKVAGFYLDMVKEIVEKTCRETHVFIFPEGEENKNLQTVNKLYRYLIQHEFDRKDMLVALGGGVTGDLTGFTAATYLRGIDFIQVPTSLLSQVDSSIGGKTGVDYEAYKNMVGAFYMPKLVYINTHTIHTLDDRQFISGMGEVIKHGLIRDKEYYQWMKEKKDSILAREDTVMAELIYRSCRIKRDVVQEDPKEHGIRAYLNFGHTVGHSVEKLMDFRLTHGECVGIGAVIAAAISWKRGFISKEEYQDITNTFAYFKFPDFPKELNLLEVVEATRHDKKMEHGSIKFILLTKVGQAGIYKDVTEADMLEALKEAQ